jgi:DNA primase
MHQLYQKKQSINKASLKEFIEKGNVAFKEGNVSFIFTCPKCSKDRKLYIRKSDGKFVCFVCREKDNYFGKAEYALSDLYGMPIDAVRKEIYDQNQDIAIDFLDFTLTNPFQEDEIEEEFEFDLPPPEVQYTNGIVTSSNPQFERGRRYLIDVRGLTEDIIKHYDLRYNTVWNTVVFPVNVNGRLLGWQERGITNNFKYTLKGFQKEKTLMFHDNLNGSDHAILCEGPVDALKTHLCGGGVASMGKGVSPAQLDIIKGKVKKLYIALDPDASEEIYKLAKYMSDYVDVFIMTPVEGKKDLGECTLEEVYEQFKKAEQFFGQIFLHLKR